MKNFKNLAKRILNGSIKGIFVLRNGKTVSSYKFHTTPYRKHPYFIEVFGDFDKDGNSIKQNIFDIIDFMKD